MIINNNFTHPDEFYDALSALHADLDDEASNDLNARLVFVLANQIGDIDVLKQCLRLAVDTGSTTS